MATSADRALFWQDNKPPMFYTGSNPTQNSMKTSGEVSRNIPNNFHLIREGNDLQVRTHVATNASRLLRSAETSKDKETLSTSQAAKCNKDESLVSNIMTPGYYYVQQLQSSDSNDFKQALREKKRLEKPFSESYTQEVKNNVVNANFAQPENESHVTNYSSFHSIENSVKEKERTLKRQASRFGFATHNVSKPNIESQHFEQLMNSNNGIAEQGNRSNDIGYMKPSKDWVTHGTTTNRLGLSSAINSNIFTGKHPTHLSEKTVFNRPTGSKSPRKNCKNLEGKGPCLFQPSLQPNQHTAQPNQKFLKVKVPRAPLSCPPMSPVTRVRMTSQGQPETGLPGMRTVSFEFERGVDEKQFRDTVMKMMEVANGGHAETYESTLLFDDPEEESEELIPVLTLQPPPKPKLKRQLSSDSDSLSSTNLSTANSTGTSTPTTSSPNKQVTSSLQPQCGTQQHQQSLQQQQQHQHRQKQQSLQQQQQHQHRQKQQLQKQYQPQQQCIEQQNKQLQQTSQQGKEGQHQQVQDQYKGQGCDQKNQLFLLQEHQRHTQHQQSLNQLQQKQLHQPPLHLPSDRPRELQKTLENDKHEQFKQRFQEQLIECQRQLQENYSMQSNCSLSHTSPHKSYSSVPNIPDSVQNCSTISSEGGVRSAPPISKDRTLDLSLTQLRHSKIAYIKEQYGSASNSPKKSPKRLKSTNVSHLSPVKHSLSPLTFGNDARISYRGDHTPLMSPSIGFSSCESVITASTPKPNCSMHGSRRIGQKQRVDLAEIADSGTQINHVRNVLNRTEEFHEPVFLEHQDQQKRQQCQENVDHIDKISPVLTNSQTPIPQMNTLSKPTIAHQNQSDHRGRGQSFQHRQTVMQQSLPQPLSPVKSKSQKLFARRSGSSEPDIFIFPDVSQSSTDVNPTSDEVDGGYSDVPMDMDYHEEFGYPSDFPDRLPNINPRGFTSNGFSYTGSTNQAVHSLNRFSGREKFQLHMGMETLARQTQQKLSHRLGRREDSFQPKQANEIGDPFGWSSQYQTQKSHPYHDSRLGGAPTPNRQPFRGMQDSSAPSSRHQRSRKPLTPAQNRVKMVDTYAEVLDTSEPDDVVHFFDRGSPDGEVVQEYLKTEAQNHALHNRYNCGMINSLGPNTLRNWYGHSSRDSQGYGSFGSDIFGTRYEGQMWNPGSTSSDYNFAGSHSFDGSGAGEAMFTKADTNVLFISPDELSGSSMSCGEECNSSSGSQNKYDGVTFGRDCIPGGEALWDEFDGSVGGDIGHQLDDSTSKVNFSYDKNNKIKPVLSNDIKDPEVNFESHLVTKQNLSPVKNAPVGANEGNVSYMHSPRKEHFPSSHKAANVRYSQRAQISKSDYHGDQVFSNYSHSKQSGQDFRRAMPVLHTPKYNIKEACASENNFKYKNENVCGFNDNIQGPEDDDCSSDEVDGFGDEDNKKLHPKNVRKDSWRKSSTCFQEPKEGKRDEEKDEDDGIVHIFDDDDEETDNTMSMAQLQQNLQ
ncbi:hypothetical protein ElyMa_004614300 [Elysia marginata]|uniref:Uncharacterized protein n=1 Tax=Elysia marginata TaxID=1093978 RepID=A0AAV4HXM4_9GAST|nr:hypothetical protein ElyMa_004614300 [Elysia marginata]